MGLPQSRWDLRSLLKQLGWLNLTTAAGLANPAILQVLIDDVFAARRPDLLWRIAAVLGGLALVRFALSLVQARLYSSITARVLLEMRRDFLAHLTTLPPRFFAGRRFGDGRCATRALDRRLGVRPLEACTRTMRSSGTASMPNG